MKYIAYVTKGLERVTEQEIKQLIKDVHIEEVADKRVIFETIQSVELLVQLKTVDDLGVFIGKVENLGKIEDLSSYLQDYELINIRNFITQYRKIAPNTFSLTVGLSGSNLKAPAIINTLKELLVNQYSWEYTELDHTNFDIRIFIDHKTAYFSIRVTRESLHQRSYKTDSKSGSLKPSVAAAMVLMATEGKKELKVIDNFCGSGTILCEALLAGNQVYGGDVDPESVRIARANLNNLNYRSEDNVKVLNAIKTSWLDNLFDCAISNLPWDEQIKVSSITELYEGSIREYMRILKPDGVLCVLVSKPELFIKYAKKYRPDAKIESQKIGLLGQNPTIVIAH